MIYSRIVATGSYLPETVVPNQELEKWVQTTDAWISERTGIRARCIASDTDTAASMGTQAALKALAAAQLSPESIDLIIVATCTGDYALPSTACVIQANLGIAGTPAFDVSAACSGFCYALSIADLFIHSQQATRALVIGSEVMSRMLDWSDRTTCVLFGDGAGAVIIERAETPGLLDSSLHADGRFASLLYAADLQFGRGATASSPYLKMQGKEVFKLAVQKGVEVINTVLIRNQLSINDIDWIIPHQANTRIIQMMAHQLSLPIERFVLTLAEQGNTSAASIPLALDHAVREGIIQRGQRIMTLGFGGGFTWACNLFQY